VIYSRAGTSLAAAPASQFSLAEAIDEAISLVRLHPRSRTHIIRNACAAELRLHGDRTRLVQVFVNLLHNACDASADDAPIEVRARAGEGGRTAEVEIADRGTGIPAEVRRRLFEPFVTTKEPGKGTGLGLSLALNIVRDHGGTLDIDSEAGEGTTVRLALPLERPS
jgi:signal transduction histidine kinase